MKISSLFTPNGILLNRTPKDKQEALEIMIKCHEALGNLYDEAEFKNAVLEREASTTTGIGKGMAIPHAMVSAVKRPSIVAMTVDGGVDFDSLDNKPVNLIFLIAMPDDGGQHMSVLSRLATLLMDESLFPALTAAKTVDEFIDFIDELENSLFPEESEEKPPEKNKTYKLLAVTACPMGISHTYMAAEALEKAADKLGYSIKVETNGSAGAANVLTSEEIEQAEAIIIAADKNVDMERFNGKHVLIASVTDGVRKPETLIKDAVNNDKIYKFKGESNDEPVKKIPTHEGVAHRFYKYLMSGVSYMLPFAIGGGILHALSYLIDMLMLGNNALDFGVFGTGTQVSAFLNALGEYAFDLMMPILSGYIALSIADRPGLAIGILGGFMANIGMTFTHPEGLVSSGFIGALAAGFFAGGFMRLLERICSYIPKSLSGLKPVLIYPVAGMVVIGFMMGAVNPFAALFNNSLMYDLNALSGGGRIVLGCVLGGMMALDMGGPLSKAAYLYATLSIASGESDAMAAVMLGGMTPPIGIALATTFFRDKFSDSERKSGGVNYILGLCFITEGAIPYAASDPLSILPSCFIGSALAGGLSMSFGCTLQIPHGGMFILPFVGNQEGFLFALLVGSLATMLMIAILKKREPIKIKNHILNTGIFD